MATEIQLYSRQYDAFERTITLVDDGGAELDTTSAEVRLRIMKRAGGAYLIEAESADANGRIDIDNAGVLTISLPHDDSELIALPLRSNALRGEIDYKPSGGDWVTMFTLAFFHDAEGAPARGPVAAQQHTVYLGGLAYTATVQFGAFAAVDENTILHTQVFS